MACYRYKLVHQDGKPEAGTCCDVTAADLRRLIATTDQDLLSLKRLSSWERWLYRVRRSRAPETQLLTTLSELLVSGMCVTEALQLSASLLKQPSLRLACAMVRAGAPLGQALKNLQLISMPAALMLIAIGEKTGNLHNALSLAAEKCELLLVQRRKAFQSLIYPGFLFLLCCVTTVVLVDTVLPQIYLLKASLGVAANDPYLDILPILKQLPLVIGLSVLTCVGAFAVQKYCTRLWPGFAFAVSRWCMKIPAYHHAVMAQFYTAYAYAEKLQPGHSYENLHLLTQADWAPAYKGALEATAAQVRMGAPLHVALEKNALVHADEIAFIALGERTNTLVAQSNRLAKHHFQALEKSIRTVVALAGPAALLGVGTILILIVCGFLLPLYDSIVMVGL